MDVGDSSSENILPYAVVGSILPTLILLVAVTAAVIGYLRWKKYTNGARPRLQGKAFSLKDVRFGTPEGDQTRCSGTFVRGTTPHCTKWRDPNQLIPCSCIHLMNYIGGGQFGFVYSAHLSGWKDGSQDGIVAVKTLKEVNSQGDIDALLKESLKMKDFNHSNVLNLIGVSLDAGESPYIVMPLMSNGSLLNYLKKRRPTLNIVSEAPEELIQDTRRQLLAMCLQIVRGMEYLAGCKVVHRDLAARNCMIDAKGVIKVADFGLSQNLYTKTYFRELEEEARLPVKWMAIESLTDCIFTEKSDVWSFGVTCWEVFTLGIMPYPGVDPFTTTRYLLEGGRLTKPLNAACDDRTFEIFQSCWKKDPEERPEFSHLERTITTYLEELAGGYMTLSSLNLDTSACEELPTLQEHSFEVPVEVTETESAC